jgi:hypothetical protein
LRHLLILAALIAALTLPFLAPAPVNAGVPEQSLCPEGYDGPISIAEIQSFEFRKGLPRAAAAADVDHSGYVCYKLHGAEADHPPGVTFVDDISPYLCMLPDSPDLSRFLQEPLGSPTAAMHPLAPIGVTPS